VPSDAATMERDAIIRLLRDHESELRAAGIVRLALFGSAARREQTADSDIDLLAALDSGRRLSLLDIIHLENWLSDLLGRKVDLVEDSSLKPDIRRRAAKDSVRAF